MPLIRHKGPVFTWEQWGLVLKDIQSTVPILFGWYPYRGKPRLGLVSCNTFGATMTSVVPVAIHSQATKKKVRSSKVKAYLLHPTTNPIQQIAPYNSWREKLEVNSNDSSVVIAMDLPSADQVPSPSTSAIAPAGEAVILGTTGNGFPGYTIFGPDPVWAIAIVGNGNSRINVIQTGWEDAELSCPD